MPARLAKVRLHNIASAIIRQIFSSWNKNQVIAAIIPANNIPFIRPTRNSFKIIRAVLREVSSLVANARTTTASVWLPVVPPIEATIGINTAKIGDYYSSAGVEGLGFAIPVHIAKDVVDQLIETGYIPGRPSLGVETVVLDLQDRLYFNLPDGLYITSVDESSNSWAVGIRPRDLLISVNGQSVTSQEELAAALSSFSVGDSVNVIIYRSGRQLTADIVLQEATQ